MDPKYWSKPVVYGGKALGGYRTVASTREAARTLSQGWPVGRGRNWAKARQACAEVLDGRKPPSDARRAFIDAAYEADLTVRDG